MAFEAFGLEPHGREERFHLRITRLAGWIIGPLPIDGGRTRFLDKLGDHIYRRAAPQNQAVAFVGDGLLKGRNTLPQPPF